MSFDRLPRILILLLVAIAARAQTFGNPTLHVDETIYFEIADAMLRGAVPYVDVWDRKPIGLFLLYAVPAAFGLKAGIWIYQLMALASVVGTALGIAALASRAGWTRGATLAAIAYILWLNLIEGQGGQAPVFYNLLMVGAVLLVAPRADEAARPATRFWRSVAAMALVGVAIQIKYSVLFEGFFLGLWLMWREWRLGRSLPAIGLRAAAWAGIALAPTLAAWGVYSALGHGEAFVFANFTSIAARRSDPALELAWNLTRIVLIISPLVAMCVLGWRMPPASAMKRYLFGWLIAAGLGVLLFGSWFDHYALPLLVPLAVCAAGFIGDHRHGRRFLLGFLVLVALGGQFLVGKKIRDRGSAAQFGDLTAAIGSGSGCLYTHSGPSLLYGATGRCFVTPYIFPSHLSRWREGGGAVGVDPEAEVQRIFTTARPAVVVMRPPYRGEDAAIRAQVLGHLARDYRAPGMVSFGKYQVAVYHRRQGPPDAPFPRSAADRARPAQPHGRDPT